MGIDRQIQAAFLLTGILLSSAACSASLEGKKGRPTATLTPSPPRVVVIYHTLTPTPVPTQVPSPGVTPTLDNDPAHYFGGFIVTMDDVGQTITMKRGQSFQLGLTDGYDWQVELDPAGVVSRNQKITPARGDQGVYVARMTGKTTLRAIGKPVCRDVTPACERPDILFTLHLIVN